MPLNDIFEPPHEFKEEGHSEFLQKLVVDAEYRADILQKESSSKQEDQDTTQGKYTLGYTLKKLAVVTTATLTTAAIITFSPFLRKDKLDYFAQRDAKLDSLNTVDNKTLVENIQSQYRQLQSNFDDPHSASKNPTKQQLYELFFAQEALQMVNYPNPTFPESVGPTKESTQAQQTIANISFAMLNASFEKGDSVGIYLYHADTKQLAEYRLFFGDGGKAQKDDKGRYIGHEDRTLHVEKIIHGGIPQESQHHEIHMQGNSSRSLYSIVQSLPFK